MLISYLRAAFLYLVLILSVRLMGKRQIGELEVTDLVTTLLLSEIAAQPITNPDIPLLNAILPMGVLLVLGYFMFHTILRVFEWGDGLIHDLRKKKEEGTLWSPFDDVM